MSFLREFRGFVARGNVVELAVGVIIGAAFTGIVNSLVNDILMPPLGVLIGGVDFSNYFIPLDGGTYATLEQAREAGAAPIAYGKFLNALIQFLIVALAVFLLVRQVNRLWGTAKPAPREEVRLLAEIRDLLKTRGPGITP
ncbi:MAG TPA: large conductance mechanosensitive channel protein MscL [Azospirillaceae bacterium]|nr:large conductance mechanosensitive channel protein MscL [Azospirillaceae bacterium]